MPSALSARADFRHRAMPPGVRGRLESSGHSLPRSAATPWRIKYSSSIAISSDLPHVFGIRHWTFAIQAASFSGLLAAGRPPPCRQPHLDGARLAPGGQPHGNVVPRQIDRLAQLELGADVTAVQMAAFI